MSESTKGNSAKYLWKFGVKNLFQVTRSDIKMGETDRVGDGVLYMQRLLFEFGKRRRSIRFHVIHAADPDNCLHDHPWFFYAFVIWGGYVEEVPRSYSELYHNDPDVDWQAMDQLNATKGFPYRHEVVVKPFRIHYRPLNYKHRIVRLLRKFSITVAYAGPLSQHWGFHTNHGKENWEDFVPKDQETRVGWCSTDKR